MLVIINTRTRLYYIQFYALPTSCTSLRPWARCEIRHVVLSGERAGGAAACPPLRGMSDGRVTADFRYLLIVIVVHVQGAPEKFVL